jgi:hypothetical protein
LKIKRRNGEQIWAFRWYENAGGSRSYRKRLVSSEKALANGRATELLLPETVSTLTAPSALEGKIVSC